MRVVTGRALLIGRLDSALSWPLGQILTTSTPSDWGGRGLSARSSIANGAARSLRGPQHPYPVLPPRHDGLAGSLSECRSTCRNEVHPSTGDSYGGPIQWRH